MRRQPEVVPRASSNGPARFLPIARLLARLHHRRAAVQQRHTLDFLPNAFPSWKGPSYKTKKNSAKPKNLFNAFTAS